MKTIGFILLFIAGIHFCWAQDFLARIGDSAGCFSFIRMKSGSLSRYAEKYRGETNPDRVVYMTAWGVSGDGEMYWTNGEEIYKCNWDSKSELIVDYLHWISEFTVRGQFAYVVYNPDKEEGLADDRFEEGLKFCRINLKTRNREEFSLPKGLNVTNLCVSENGKWATFINSRFDHIENRYDLVLYNMGNGQSKIIDTGDVSKSTWFGDYDKVNSACWKDSVTVLYYKNEKEEGYGSIFSYSLKNQSRKVWLSEFPERDFSWFAVWNNFLYYSRRDGIYKTKDGKKKEFIFKDFNIQVSILDVKLLPL